MHMFLLYNKTYADAHGGFNNSTVHQVEDSQRNPCFCSLSCCHRAWKCTVQGIVNIPMTSLQTLWSREVSKRGEGEQKIDCKCWIIQQSPPPFEWVTLVTFRRAFIAKQEKIIFHRPLWRPWTSLINDRSTAQTHSYRVTVQQTETQIQQKYCWHWQRFFFLLCSTYFS